MNELKEIANQNNQELRVIIDKNDVLNDTFSEDAMESGFVFGEVFRTLFYQPEQPYERVYTSALDRYEGEAGRGMSERNAYMGALGLGVAFFKTDLGRDVREAVDPDIYQEALENQKATELYEKKVLENGLWGKAPLFSSMSKELQNKVVENINAITTMNSPKHNMF